MDYHGGEGTVPTIYFIFNPIEKICSVKKIKCAVV